LLFRTLALHFTHGLLHDVESDARHAVTLSASALERYRELLAAHLSTLEAMAERHHALYARLPSDTRVEDARLLERCAAAKQAGVAVLGPYVRDPNDAPQNPMEAHLSLRYIAALSLGPAWDALRRLLSRTRLRRTLHIGVPGSIRTQGAAALVDVYMVHGCFLYLSEHYLNQFPLLDEDLFMYGEEDLIAFNCLRKRLRVAYDPQMRVHHRDAKSTRSGDFRNQAVVASMRALRAKIGFTRLVHAYLSARRH